MLCFFTALPMDAGIACDSGSAFRKTYLPICVIPFAVVEVPMIGTPLAFASGPATIISLERVGPMIATTCSELMSFCAAASACSCLPEESSIFRSTRTSPFAFTSSRASLMPLVIASPYAAPWPVMIEMTPIFALIGSAAGFAAGLAFSAPMNTKAKRAHATTAIPRTDLLMEHPPWNGLRMQFYRNRTAVLVPGGGIEPPRPRGLGILSPVRLPVPPPGLPEERYHKWRGGPTRRRRAEEGVEAAPGFEPGDKGFAVLCLTTWLCRRNRYYRRMPRACQALRGCCFHVRKVRPGFIFIHKVVLWFSTVPRFCRPGGLLC